MNNKNFILEKELIEKIKAEGKFYKLILEQFEKLGVFAKKNLQKTW